MAEQSAKEKICIVTPEFPPQQWGGLARTVGRVAAHARDMGLEVHVAHLNVESQPVVLLDENREDRVDDGITIHRLTVGTEHMPQGQRSLWDCPHTLTLQMMYQSLEKLASDHEFVLFHSFFLYPVGYVSGLLARRKARPSIVTLVGNDIKKYIFSPEKVGVCQIGLEKADRVAALSRDLVEMAHSLAPIEHKARIIYNSVDIPDGEWKPHKRPDAPCRIGCAGIFKYAKGLPYLFKALALLTERRRLVLELVGNLRASERHTYEIIVQRTGIGEVIQFRDPVPHDVIFDWLRSLDLYVLPSVSEGCPNILMEAMAAGVPCVATRTGAAEVLMDDHSSGLLVPWGDSYALAEAIAEIMDNPGRAAGLGSAAREKMRQFSSQRERSAWEALYRELIDF